MTLAPRAQRALLDAVGPRHLLDDVELVAPYCTDWTGRFGAPAAAVVRPGSPDEVAAVLDACRGHGLAVVPQGGNTGLVGGSVPRSGEVVVSLIRLDDVDSPDPRTREITAGAGATIAAVAAAAAGAGLAYGVDWAARDRATVGGSIATDAGGLHVVAYGSTRRQLEGVEAVLGSGERIDERGRPDRDATGDGLSGLLCGSEGTLGIVTSARLRLVEPPRALAVALLALRSWSDAARAATDLRRTLPGVRALEAWGAEEADLVARLRGRTSPMGSPPVTLLIECGSDDDPARVLGGAVDALSGIDEVAVALDGPRRSALWESREALTEALGPLAPHKLDVSLPLDALGDGITELRSRVVEADPQARCWIFGHLGEGNLHVNVTGPAPDDGRTDDAVLGLVLELGGSVSAEHGVGVAKRTWAARQRGAAATEAMRAVKRALDPAEIMNPGVLL